MVALSIVFLVISGAFAFTVWALHSFQQALYEDPVGPAWLNRILLFVIMGTFDVTSVAGFIFLILWIPYFLIYQLSPKQFWINDNTLFHTARLLGFIPYKRKITFEQILNVEAGSSNGRHAVTVLYERNLPKWLFIILVHWNEKLTQWPLTLINGIPTKEEAEKLQTDLLKPMTASPVCRVGS